MEAITKDEMRTEDHKEVLTRGFLFVCTADTQEECFSRMTLATETAYGPVAIRVRKGDLLFLHNINTDVLYGVFRAVSTGFFSRDVGAFNRKYPYQVRIENLGQRLEVYGAKSVLKGLSVRRNTPLFGGKLEELLARFADSGAKAGYLHPHQRSNLRQQIAELIECIRNSVARIDIEEEIPQLEATTFWDFPRQSYGLTPKGDNKYAGVTPALIIYNMVWRYTEPGDLVVDPMCGSGTTIDVCNEEKRSAIGYDIHPARKDIVKNDARDIPLPDASADMVFIDSPYGDNIKYNEEPQNIGSISSESEEFYDELERVMKEAHRILRDGKVLGWLIGDQWVRKKFTPVGLKIYERLCRYFEPVDIICVSRRSQSSNTVVWQNRARRFNFYLRGFKYLLIVRKRVAGEASSKPRAIKWARYAREGANERPKTRSRRSHSGYQVGEH